MINLLHWLVANPIPTVIIIGALCVILIYFIAFVQGRAVSWRPPRIEGKPRHIQSSENSSMGVMEVIQTRKSVRAYTDRLVDDEKLNSILNAGRLAPSASNRQEWRFVIVRERTVCKKLAAVAGKQGFVGEAPVVIVACAETDGHMMQCGQLCYPIDVAIALDHMSLAAVELGLGTCWIGMFDEKKVKQLLGIPEAIRVVELMTLGYPVNPDAIEKKRLPLSRIVKFEHW